MTTTAPARGRLTLTFSTAILLLTLLIEVLWAYPWFARVSRAEHWALPPLSLAATAGLAAVTALLTREVLHRRWNIALARAVIMGGSALLLVALLVLGIDGGISAATGAMWGGGLALGAYLIWRGVVVGSDPPRFDGLYRRFLIGIAGIAVLLPFWDGDKGEVTAYAVSFFACALTALALMNIQSIQADLAKQAEGGRLLSQRWLPMLIGVVLGIIIISIGIASAFSPDLVASMGHGAATLYRWLVTVILYVVIYPLSFVVVGIGYALRFLVSLATSKERPHRPDVNPGDFKALFEENQQESFAPWVVMLIKWSIVAIIVLLVLGSIAYAIYRTRRTKQDEEIEEVSESVGSWGAVRADLLAMLVKLFARFRWRRSDGEGVLVTAPPIAAAEGDAGTRQFTVREIYQGLLYEGEKWGVARRPPETPYEYEGKLHGHVATPADVETVTAAYVAQRYGDEAPDAARLAHLNQLWRRIRQSFRGAMPTTDVYGRKP